MNTADTLSTRATVTKREDVAIKPIAIANIPKPTLLSSINTLCHSSITACWIKNWRIIIYLEFVKLLADVAIAFATAKFRAMLNGGKVEGNRRGSGVNGFHALEASHREVAKLVSTRSGSFSHCNRLRGLTSANAFRFAGFAVALLLTLIFKGPREDNYTCQEAYVSRAFQYEKDS